MKLSHINKNIPLKIKWINYKRDLEIDNFNNNSNYIKNNGLFITIKGKKKDGKDYILSAIKNGAKVVISDNLLSKDFIKNTIKQNDITIGITENTKKFLAYLSDLWYNTPSKSLYTIGITGTNGKTTTSIFIYNILKSYNINTGLIGTLYYSLGNNKNINISNKEYNNFYHYTTPEPILLAQLLNKMIKNKCTHLVIEASSQGLDQERLCFLNFKRAVLTNFDKDHLDYHESIENYFNSKAKLFSYIPKDGYCILNFDDKSYNKFKERIKKAQVINYGFSEKADIYLKDYNYNFRNKKLELTIFIKPIKENIKVNLNLIGKFNIYNVLAAISTTFTMNIPLNNIIRGIESVINIPGRLERVELELLYKYNIKLEYNIIIDYAHTPDGLKKLLLCVKEFFKPKRILLVFGCGGDRYREKRKEMGKIAEEYSNYCWITNDNPRNEEPKKIIDDILQGFKYNKNYEVIYDRKEAIYTALKNATAGDCIVIAGKGHENFQIIKDKKIEFSDRKVVISYFIS